MATLTVQNIVEAGMAPTYSAATSGGDVFPNDAMENTFIHIKNGGGGSINLTVTAQNTSFTTPQWGTLTKSDRVVAVGAGAEKMIGPFPRAVFNNASGQVSLTYSGVTTVTIAVIKV